jgi:hypothetical protein
MDVKKSLGLVAALATSSFSAYFLGFNDGVKKTKAEMADASVVYYKEVEEFRQVVEDLAKTEISISAKYGVPRVPFLFHSGLALSGSDTGIGNLEELVRKHIPPDAKDDDFLKMARLLKKIDGYDLPKRTKQNVVIRHLIFYGL